MQYRRAINHHIITSLSSKTKHTIQNSQCHVNDLSRTAILNKMCGKPPQYARPMQVDNIFVFIRQLAGLFRHVGDLRHHQQVDL